MIITGDCGTALAGMEAASVDVIIADPPYGETSLEWDRWPDGWHETLGKMDGFGELARYREVGRDARNGGDPFHYITPSALDQAP